MRRVALNVAWLLAAAAAHGETLADYAPRASCLLAPNHVYKLSMPSSGTLSLVAVERADKVRKGDALAELESGVEQSQLDAAKARAATDLIQMKRAVLESAQAKVERERTLQASRIASQQALDEAVAAAAGARADVAQAVLDHTLAKFEVQRLEVTLQRRVLRAPADGVVTSVDLHVGEYADPATPVATVTEIDPLKAEVYLPAAAYALVRVGMTAKLTPQQPDGPARDAVVITKDPQIDASSGLFQIELRLPNPDQAVPAGVRCRVVFAP